MTADPSLPPGCRFCCFCFSFSLVLVGRCGVAVGVESRRGHWIIIALAALSAVFWGHCMAIHMTVDGYARASTPSSCLTRRVTVTGGIRPRAVSPSRLAESV